MGPKKACESGKVENVRTIISENIQKHENGIHVSNLDLQDGLKFSICTILKNKEARKNLILEEVEKLLLILINEKQLVGDNISETIICEKAKYFHYNLLNYLGTRNGLIPFKLISIRKIISICKLFNS